MQKLQGFGQNIFQEEDQAVEAEGSSLTPNTRKRASKRGTAVVETQSKRKKTHPIARARIVMQQPNQSQPADEGSRNNHEEEQAAEEGTQALLQLLEDHQDQQASGNEA